MTHEPLGYPFSALVGQGLMKRALILAAVHPGLGGVLIRGSKGAAKSTAVRALAEILPAIEVYDGDPFARGPGEDVEGWPIPDAAAIRTRAVALVNLPVGATDDRVVGSLNLERALASGERAFEPGLLARAHRGLLYIDEVNLLPDHLVDLLLDASAMGVNHVEREGLTFRHPSRFVLVGTMNPEEGEIRPQLLDRFGLAVEVEPMTDPTARAEVVRRRLAFEADPRAFRARWAEARRRRRAEHRSRLAASCPQVVVPAEILDCDLRPVRPRRGRRAPGRPDHLQGRIGPGRPRGPDDRDSSRTSRAWPNWPWRTAGPPPRRPGPPGPPPPAPQPPRPDERDRTEAGNRESIPRPRSGTNRARASTQGPGTAGGRRRWRSRDRDPRIGRPFGLVAVDSQRVDSAASTGPCGPEGPTGLGRPARAS